jgi:RNA polymerase sigma-70 factor (ECF subfamily)
MYYKNQDYTVWEKTIGGHVRYFLKFYSQTDSSAIEIGKDIFDTYLKEFNKPLECQRNEKRRHLEADDIDGLMVSGDLTTLPFEQSSIAKIDIYEALKACTAVQRKRLILHHIRGYSFTEIAKMEGCDYSSVRESVRAAEKNILKYFLDNP